eukprot:1160534-Pelagomonas_calceolata.AAC.3
MACCGSPLDVPCKLWQLGQCNTQLHSCQRLLKNFLPLVTFAFTQEPVLSSKAEFQSTGKEHPECLSR